MGVIRGRKKIARRIIIHSNWRSVFGHRVNGFSLIFTDFKFIKIFLICVNGRNSWQKKNCTANQNSLKLEIIFRPQIKRIKRIFTDFILANIFLICNNLCNLCRKKIARRTRIHWNWRSFFGHRLNGLNGFSLILSS